MSDSSYPSREDAGSGLAEELSAGMASGKAVPEPFSLVIFGASGDLTRRKLIPAVYQLFRRKLLPSEFQIIGFARREKRDEEFRAEQKEAFQTGEFDEASWGAFTGHLCYHQSTFEDEDGYRRLRERLERFSGKEGAAGNCLFYLATQPGHFAVVIDQLCKAGLCKSDSGWSRIIVEKPFGRDLASAIHLNKQIQKAFHENQIFRIDHYLGKETVQNILVFRFANMLFEPLWNHNYIDHVQITVSETVGIEGRGAFYEQAGALRDIVQNHMMHLLTLVAMEPPASLEADAIREEKVQVLKSLRRIPASCAPELVVRGQYRESGDAVGYRQEPGVAADSRTETYVALKAMIDNWRWAGVPFYLRTGKRMPSRITEIGIFFKSVPKVLFNAKNEMIPNSLSLRIQPNEGICLSFQVKRPGLSTKIDPYPMHFGYQDSFGGNPPEAYERLLLDAAIGDMTLFTRSDEVEAAWRFLEPVLLGCGDSPAGYDAGTWGPKEADELIERDGRKWHLARMGKKRMNNE